MNRTELLEKLNLVAPALSSNNLVPVLSHFWFRDNTLLCYNDQIAISTKLSANFAGAVPGDTLMSLLSVSRAKEVEFFTSKDAEGKPLPDGQLLIKAASSKLKLPFLPEEQTKIFEMPKPDPTKALPVDITLFLEAIESCTRSLKEDTSMPDSLGITLAIEESSIAFYATNDSTISYSRIKLKTPIDNSVRVVLSGNFCRQMLALSKIEGKRHIEIHDDYSLFMVADTNILFGRLVDVQRPLDFDSVIENAFPKERKKDLVSIPTKLQLMLDRAVIITESKTERSKTAITVKQGVAKFFSQSEKGEVRDSVQLEDAHPDVEVSIDPRLFKAGYGFFDKFTLTDQCLIMTKGSSLYLVSVSS
jgi:DNA polymerase III sliding clamp (beta) subunit (PCNA family)